jgi:hypothetical protein
MQRIYGVEHTVLVELRVPLTMAIDIFPRLGVGEGELIGHGTENRAIFKVKLMNIERPATAEQTPDTIDLQKRKDQLDTSKEQEKAGSRCSGRGGTWRWRRLTGEILARKGPGYLASGWKYRL